MKTQHTQGEWVSKQTHQNYEEFFIMIKHDHGLSRLDNKSGAFSEANARLIASAPDLLKALEKIVSWIETNNINIENYPWHTVQKALIKAKGES